jgi:hypothetical protein
VALTITTRNAQKKTARPASRMKNKLKWMFAGPAAALALLQFTNPSRTNPPVVLDLMATNPPPPKIAALLHAACYDCHSYETRWPWYGHVAPVSWLIANDVNKGRRRLNLSDWPAGQPERAARLLDRMSEEIGYHEMPPGKYTALHANARLTDGERKELADWLDAQSSRLDSMPEK